jgi:hypothetical protein
MRRAQPGSLGLWQPLALAGEGALNNKPGPKAPGSWSLGFQNLSFNFTLARLLFGAEQCFEGLNLSGTRLKAEI